MIEFFLKKKLYYDLDCSLVLNSYVIISNLIKRKLKLDIMPFCYIYIYIFKIN